MKLKTKFQDEDFDLGEVTDVDIATMPDGRIKAQARAMRGGLHTFFYKTKAEFDADWEDVLEEPKSSALDLMILTLINFIENEPDEDKVDLEDCKQMLGKLKAWKRLKDRGFKFNAKWTSNIPDGCWYDVHCHARITPAPKDAEFFKDLDLLFSQEDD